MVPQNQTDRGTRFRVSRIVGQIVVGRESFIIAGGAYPAGNVQAFRSKMLPEACTGLEEGWIIQFFGQIDHSAVEVHSANRVADNFGLFANREVRLIVLVGFGPEVGGIFTTCPRLTIEIVRLP